MQRIESFFVFLLWSKTIMFILEMVLQLKFNALVQCVRSLVLGKNRQADSGLEYCLIFWIFRFLFSGWFGFSPFLLAFFFGAFIYFLYAFGFIPAF